MASAALTHNARRVGARPGIPSWLRWAPIAIFHETGISENHSKVRLEASLIPSAVHGPRAAGGARSAAVISSNIGSQSCLKRGLVAGCFAVEPATTEKDLANRSNSSAIYQRPICEGLSRFLQPPLTAGRDYLGQGLSALIPERRGQDLKSEKTSDDCSHRCTPELTQWTFARCSCRWRQRWSWSRPLPYHSIGKPSPP